MVDFDTPIIQQYKNIKQHHKDKILLFCCGDFFEMFFEDGEKAASILGITLTSRKNGNERIPMCGIPVINKDFYIKKLIENGYKIAICEQTESPEQAKKRGAKLVNRTITQIYTPGTYVDQIGSYGGNNYIISLTKNSQNMIFVFYIDISTEDFFYERIKEEELFNLLNRIDPKEIITKDNHNLQLAKWEEISTFLPSVENKEKNYWNISNEILDFLKFSVPEERESLELLFQHIKNTFNKIPSKAPKIGVTSMETTLDRYTIENLNLFGIKGSFFEFINHCYTPAGKRLLKQWLLKPLICKVSIEERQELIKFFFKKNQIDNIENFLRSIGDIQRNLFLLKKSIKGKKNSHIIENLLKGLRSGEELISMIVNESSLPKILGEKIYNYEKMNGYIALERVFVPDGSLFKEDFLKHLYGESNLTDTINNINQHRLMMEEYIPNIKLSKNSIIGYYFEVSPKDKNLISKLPFVPIIKQTLISGTRFTTETLVKLESHLLLLEEEQEQIKNNVLNNFLQNIFQEEDKVDKLIRIIELIDIGVNLAILAKKYNYSCPLINNNGILSFEKGRHPILETKTNNFIENNFYMDNNRLMFITGPNMGGKSTFMRTTALIILLAQIGSFVPGENVSIAPMCNIFVRIGFNDNEQEGESTFYKEMKECANILNQCEKANTLIFFDEICRGTSYEEGMVLTNAIIDYLLEKKVYVLLSTHYLSLGERIINSNGILTFYTAYKEEGNKLIFLYKMISGISDLSFGIKVAHMAGLPNSIIDNANKYIKCKKKSYI